MSEISNKEFLIEYLNNPSPSGFEVKLGSQKIWANHIGKYAKSVSLDNYGSAIAVLGNPDSKYKVVIEAHADEIGWYVNYIDDKGFIRVIRNGGSDMLITPSMRVDIHTKKGKVNGVFGHPAIHVHKNDHKVNLETIFVDCGATSKKEVEELGIEIGTPITFSDGYYELGDKWICGRALDNKIGGYIIAEVARYIHENNIQLPYQLCITNSTMEEIGLGGSKMNAKTINPNVALIVDVCHDTTPPCYNEQKLGITRAGDGGVLTVAPAVHNNVLDFWRESLDKDGIKYQLSTSTNQTGTDTDSYAFENSTPSCLISIPLSYMHCSIEKCHKEDVETIVKSFVSILTKIEEGQNFGYTL